jgi:hypothetical protein
VLNPKINKKWNSRVRIDLHMYIMTWPAATPMHLYVQVNANKHDSDLPHAQNAFFLAGIENVCMAESMLIPNQQMSLVGLRTDFLTEMV